MTGEVWLAEDNTLLSVLLKDAVSAHVQAGKITVFRSADDLFGAYDARLASDKPRPVLFVIDIVMPDEDGLTLGRRLREREREAGQDPVPVVFYSARALDDEIDRALDDCFPARFVQKAGEDGPALVALAGAKLVRYLLDQM